MILQGKSTDLEWAKLNEMTSDTEHQYTGETLLECTIRVYSVTWIRHENTVRYTTLTDTSVDLPF